MDGIQSVVPMLPVVNGAPMGQLGTPGEFYPTKMKLIKVIKVGSDEDTPLTVREALVGLEVITSFTSNQIGNLSEKLPGTLLAYGDDVIEALNKAGKTKESRILKEIMTSNLDMYVFEEGVFEIIRERPDRN